LTIPVDTFLTFGNYRAPRRDTALGARCSKTHQNKRGSQDNYRHRSSPSLTERKTPNVLHYSFLLLQNNV
jgi:hypothetical protein